MRNIVKLCVVSIVFFLPNMYCKDNDTLIINSYMHDEAPKKAFNDIVEMFKKENPDIKVVVNTYAVEQYKKLFSEWLHSENPPDIATWYTGNKLNCIVKKGLLEPVDAVNPKESVDSEFSKIFKNSNSSNDKLYFVPHCWYWWGIYYNKDLFKKLNLTVPDTWEEFLVVCEKLYNSHYYPIAIGAKDKWAAGAWFDCMDSAVNGGGFHRDLTNGKISYADPKVMKTFNHIITLSRKGYILPNAGSYSWQEAANLLFSGKAGMCLMGQNIKDVAPPNAINNIDFFRFPVIDRNIENCVFVQTDGFVIPSNSKNKVAAKKFLAFITSPEIQEAFCKPLGRLSINAKVSPPNEDAKKGLLMITKSSQVLQFYERGTPEEISEKGLSAVTAIMTNPENTEFILSDLDKERIRIYRNMR